mmetsp:Transcript_52046/g.145277  ORF Transcript_52046/g.145277 Transcript_52046/m.145277 type:complete len:227 (+) Transcript_52046:286-966(+)
MPRSPYWSNASLQRVWGTRHRCSSRACRRAGPLAALKAARCTTTVARAGYLSGRIHRGRPRSQGTRSLMTTMLRLGRLRRSIRSTTRGAAMCRLRRRRRSCQTPPQASRARTWRAAPSLCMGSCRGRRLAVMFRHQGRSASKPATWRGSFQAKFATIHGSSTSARHLQRRCGAVCRRTSRIETSTSSSRWDTAQKVVGSPLESTRVSAFRNTATGNISPHTMTACT